MFKTQIQQNNTNIKRLRELNFKIKVTINISSQKFQKKKVTKKYQLRTQISKQASNNNNTSKKQNKGDTLNPLSANPTKWSNTLKQFVGNLPTNCLSVFDHFLGLALKGLIMCRFFVKTIVFFGLVKAMSFFLFFTFRISAMNFFIFMSFFS